MSKPILHIALVGNPNSGKTSLFNSLTGLNQKVGNFPGVTVDKKTGVLDLEDNRKTILIDLPGTYSLYPRRADEWVAYKVLMNADADTKADLVLLGFTKCSPNAFYSSPNRLNVALTRARHKLYLFGNKPYLKKSKLSALRDLATNFQSAIRYEK